MRIDDALRREERALVGSRQPQRGFFAMSASASRAARSSPRPGRQLIARDKEIEYLTLVFVFIAARTDKTRGYSFERAPRSLRRTKCDDAIIDG